MDVSFTNQRFDRIEKRLDGLSDEFVPRKELVQMLEPLINLKKDVYKIVLYIIIAILGAMLTLIIKGIPIP